ncbi:hypothetical protein [Actinosynnema sp. NPDC020468]|uniref:hypothetical protein n=1 Tax=Actinosynnema sp. NPDC020468 TaxID=3154488 RepID=UPI0033E0D259
MKVFDVRDISKGVDAALAVVENPRHRHVLKNYRRHALLEVSGYWEDILIPTMTVENPLYRLTERGKTFVCDGMPAVRAFYADIVGRGMNVFGALEEEIAVSDHGLFMQSVFAQVLPGTDESLADEGVDPDGTYQVSHRFAGVWPYVDGRLLGEFIYDDSGSWQVDEVPRSAMLSPAQAREALAPLLAQSPLAEIEEGLRLFRDR